MGATIAAIAGALIVGLLVLVVLVALVRAAVRDEVDARFALGALLVLIAVCAFIWGAAEGGLS